LVKRSAIAKGTAVAALAVLILAGAVGLFYYTMAPSSSSTTTSSTVSSTASSSTSAATTNSTQTGPASGTCITNSSGQCQTPQGAWAQYLGYVPAGYSLAPHYPNAATYPCPSGMNPTQCKLFQASCGNGVCDPNESCATCAIDCGINGQLTCDPYTGRAGAPISVCQLGGQG
jgi:hypothetical protein